MVVANKNRHSICLSVGWLVGSHFFCFVSFWGLFFSPSTGCSISSAHLIESQNVRARKQPRKKKRKREREREREKEDNKREKMMMMTTTRNSDLLPCFCRSRSVLAGSQWAGIIFVWYRHWYWVYIYCWYETGVSVRVLSAGRKDGSRKKKEADFVSQTRER